MFLNKINNLMDLKKKKKKKKKKKEQCNKRVDLYKRSAVAKAKLLDPEPELKKVMNAKVDGRGARGRPRFGWMDGVKRALNDRRMDIREASERARNRNEW